LTLIASPRIAGSTQEERVVKHEGHEPVLLHEALELLDPRPGQVLVDATLGLGGHAEAMLERVAPTGRVVGIDRDPLALERALARLARFGESLTALHGDHADLPQLLAECRLEAVDGILFDLGLSSMQLDDPQRGFSFRFDAPLDMRMDPGQPNTAASLLAELTEEELRRVLWRYGEERRARAIARAIVERRKRAPLRRTGELAELVRHVAGPAAARYRIDPATRTFQALRIAVNGEIDALEQTLEQAERLLRPGGRLVVISFHSLEDRCVKHLLRGLAACCVCPPDLPVCGCGRQDRVRILTSKPVRASVDEIARNPRSRSAKLRAAEKL
jgi:16S rRNA (cytosine1402-N4)-methyltransferase